MVLAFEHIKYTSKRTMFWCCLIWCNQLGSVVFNHIFISDLKKTSTEWLNCKGYSFLLIKYQKQTTDSQNKATHEYYSPLSSQSWLLAAIAPEHFGMDTSDVMDSGLTTNRKHSFVFITHLMSVVSPFVACPFEQIQKKKGKQLPDACIT